MRDLSGIFVTKQTSNFRLRSSVTHSGHSVVRHTVLKQFLSVSEDFIDLEMGVISITVHLMLLGEISQTKQVPHTEAAELLQRSQVQLAA